MSYFADGQQNTIAPYWSGMTTLGAVGAQMHPIGAGESLSSIARRYGVSTQALIAANVDVLVAAQNENCAKPMAPPACPYPLPITAASLNQGLVFAGTMLRIPYQAQTSAPSSAVDESPLSVAVESSGSKGRRMMIVGAAVLALAAGAFWLSHRM